MSINEVNNDGSIESQRELGLKTWMTVINGMIKAIEDTAWKARRAGDEAVEAWDIVDLGRKTLQQDFKDLKNEAANLPDKIKRLSKTGVMLVQLTSSYRFWGTRAAFIPKSKTQASLDKLHKKNAQRFRKVSLEHGGAFLKVGQMLSARADLLPEVWIDELQVLQDQAKPEDLPTIREVIQQELGGNLDKFFLKFDAEPVASASIGQVHRATLVDGREVAVKVQRPGLESIIKMDMSLMRMFLSSLESILPPTDFETIAEEIQRAIMEELDYELEADSMAAVGDFLAEVPGVIVPGIITELSTKHILVADYIDAIKLTEALEEKQNSGDTDGVADLLGRLLDMYLRQVLHAGIFQADPHPGNLLVTPENDLVLLDFGCTMKLPNEFRDGYLKVLSAAIMKDKDTVATTLLELGFETQSGKPDTLIAFADVLLETIQNAAASFASSANGNSEMLWPTSEEIVAQAQDLLEKSEADPVTKLPAEFIMLARVFSTLGGLFTHYKPKLDVDKYLLPHLSSMIMNG